MPSAPCRLVMPRQPAVSGRVLIVDDDERQRNALAAILSDSDLDTRVAADGLEALERLTAFPADVIVADLVMPRMDGFELLRHLKERGDLTPTITLTGFMARWSRFAGIRLACRRCIRRQNGTGFLRAPFLQQPLCHGME